MSAQPHAPAGSIFDLVARAWESDQPAAFAVRPTVRIGSATLIPVAVDNGNDALKGATLRPGAASADGGVAPAHLTTIRVPTAFGLAQTIQGRQEVTYACDGVSFWTGATALAHAGDALRLGPTIQRLGDERQRWFIAASIVELLRTAGFAPGEYAIALTVAVPNTEIVMTLRVGAKRHRARRQGRGAAHPRWPDPRGSHALPQRHKLDDLPQ